MTFVRDIEKAKEKLTIEFADVFNGIVPPSAQPVDPKGFVNVVELAVGLRQEMTMELAIYTCFWHFPRLDKVIMDSQWYDYGQGTLEEATLPLTVFPGFARVIKAEDRNIRRICVTPCKVELA